MTTLGFIPSPPEKYYLDFEWRRRVALQGDREITIEKISTLIKDYNFFEDSPYNFLDFYKDIAEKFPQAKFILTTREVESWYDSFWRWSRTSIYMGFKNTFPHDVPFAYGHEIVEDEEENKEIAAGIKMRYEKRNQEIIDFFAGTNRLCVIEMEWDSRKKWETLCAFVGSSKIPDVPWPHANFNNQIPAGKI